MKTWIQKHSIGVTLAMVVAVMVMIDSCGVIAGTMLLWMLYCHRGKPSPQG